MRERDTSSFGLFFGILQARIIFRPVFKAEKLDISAILDQQKKKTVNHNIIKFT